MGGCTRETPETVLSPRELRLVDLYVRLTVLEQQHGEHPDSVEAVLDSLWATYDSLDVESTLTRLEADPVRWDALFREIDARLKKLEQAAAGQPMASERRRREGERPPVVDDESDLE